MVKLFVYAADKEMVAMLLATTNENGPVIVRVVGIEKRCAPEAHVPASSER